MSDEKHRIGKNTIGGAIVILGVVASIIGILTFFGKGTLTDFLTPQAAPATPKAIATGGGTCVVQAVPTDISVVADPTGLEQGKSSAVSAFVSEVSSALATRGDLDRYASFINIYAGAPDASYMQSGLQVADGARQALISGDLTLSKSVFKTFVAFGRPLDQIQLEIYFYTRGCNPGS